MGQQEPIRYITLTSLDEPATMGAYEKVEPEPEPEPEPIIEETPKIPFKADKTIIKTKPKKIEKPKPKKKVKREKQPDVKESKRKGTEIGGRGRGGGAQHRGITVHGNLSRECKNRMDREYSKFLDYRDYEGEVHLNINILPSGKAGEVTVRRSSGNYSLDKTAVRSIKKCRSITRKEGGKVTVSGWVTLPIIFKKEGY